MDAKNIFFQGEVELYTCQPLCYEDGAHLNYVCKLIKAIYGLEHTLQAQYQQISWYLEEISFKIPKFNH